MSLDESNSWCTCVYSLSGKVRTQCPALAAARVASGSEADINHTDGGPFRVLPDTCPAWRRSHRRSYRAAPHPGRPRPFHRAGCRHGSGTVVATGVGPRGADPGITEVVDFT